MHALPAPTALAALQPRRVAVFRALQLGDLLCAVPALRALRQALPRAHVTLVGLPWAGAFAQRFAAYVDDFLCFPGFPTLPDRATDVRAWPSFLAAAHGREFDLSIQLHGDGSRSNAVVALLGARAQAGFAPEASEGLFLRYPSQGAEPLRLLQLPAFLGAPAHDARLEFPLRPDDAAEWDAFAAVRALERGRFFCIHPGARAAARRWPPACFAAVADALARESGLQPVVTGSADEAPLARAIAAAMRVPLVDAAAPVSAGALAALLARSRLLVANDTGASHLAAALGVPSVVVFRASDIGRWAPLDRRLHRPVWDPRGTRAEAVLQQARSLLGAQSSRSGSARGASQSRRGSVVGSSWW